MKRVYFLIFTLIALISFNSLAGIKIKNLSFTKDSSKGVMTISYSGSLEDYPELKINKNSIYVIFPFDINKAKDKVSLTLRDNKIELSFPKLKANLAYLKNQKRINKTIAKTKRTPVATKRPTSKIAKDVLNEDYLNRLIAAQKTKRTETSKNQIANSQKATKTQKDEVKTTQASTKKSLLGPSKSSFSLVEYGGKFVAFLGLVLLMFYGVITIMKKGFIKKGKLGFLNKTEQVTVLSQTYIAPKKSLMLIRAHNQVFLVSNTDAGIHPISEIQDVPGLIKEGELKIAGDNFDTNYAQAALDIKTDSKIKLKEDIMQSNKQSSLSDFIDVKDKVKFSDSLKKKVKSLKPLQ
jgi:flagellar biogenesis protein FliO